MKNEHRLDIRIKNLRDVKFSDEEIAQIFSENIKCTEKIDGIKINLVITSEGPVVTYKGEILTAEEFSGVDIDKAQTESIGHSQLLFARNLASDFAKSGEINTEYFFEFTLRKPTLSRTYQKLHQLFLIGKSKIKDVRKYEGKLFTTTEEIEICNELPQIEIPDGTSLREKWENLLKFSLERESDLGGKPEGTVIMTTLGIFKIVQPEQNDKIHRQNFRLQWEMEPEKEKQYFEKIKKKSLRIISMLSEQLNAQIYTKSLEILSEFVYKRLLVLDVYHEKKTDFQMKDDIFHNCKQMLIRKMKRNDGALFIGRFQPLTISHAKILRDMKKKHDKCVVAIVKAKKEDVNRNPIPFEIQVMMIRKVIADAIIIEVPTGALFSTIQKAEININHVYCGSDRTETYAMQLKSSPEIKLHSIERDEISGTNLRDCLSRRDFERFKTLVDESCISMYDILSRYIV